LFPRLRFFRITTTYGGNLVYSLGRDDVIHFLRASPNLVAVQADFQDRQFGMRSLTRPSQTARNRQ
jgi:hypothetical protein